MLPVGLSVEVEVPATSANLGPGFDCLGLALDWRDRFRLEVADAGWRAELSGEGVDLLPTDERHLVLASARRAFDRLGVRVPGLVLTAHNTIPQGRGLGSSSAAIVAGLLAAAALARAAGGTASIDPGDWLGLATEIEGHPDNVAAALYGGFVLAFEPLAERALTGEPSAGPTVRAVAVDPHPDVRAVAFVPDQPVSTQRARGLLPAAVPHSDAAADAGRAALLVHAITRDPSLLFEATADWLHQSYRASAMPRSAQLLRSLRDNTFPAVISGAGPTVLVLTDEAGTDRVRRWAGSAEGAGAASGFAVVPLTVGAGGIVR